MGRWPILAGVLACLLSARGSAQDADREARAQLRLGVGPGVGVRYVRVPAQVGEHTLSTRPFPALDLGLQLGAARGRWSLVASVEYTSSLGLRVERSPLPDAPGKSGLRAHSLRGGLYPSYRLGAASSAPRLALFAGWMVRALRGTSGSGMLSYSLHGPLLRPELQLPLGQGLLEVHAGPELGLIVSASRELRDVTGAGPLGLSIGAALAVDLRAHELVHVVFRYTFAYATQQTGWSRAFVDADHVASARAELRY